MNINSEIYELAIKYLRRVHRSGPDNIMAICPFHLKSDGALEHNPSFAMSLINGLWFCHSCQSKGNLYTFLKNIGLTRYDITNKYGLLLASSRNNMPTPRDPLKPAVFSDSPIPESILGLFDYYPKELIDAGFTEETLRHFDVGFDSWNYRITFPIRDLAGNLVAISGRTVTDADPKYKIYDSEYIRWGLPARLNWEKATAMWNSHAVYPEVYYQSTPEFIVIVEGFKACMWVWQSGIKNVVALLGTNLTDDHKWILERMGAPICLFLDNNDPGQIGTEKSANKIRNSLTVRIVEYPERLKDVEKAQPDSLTQEEISTQIYNSVDYYKWITS